MESTGDYGRLVLQIVAGSNGFAATAILTLIGAFKSNHLAEVLSPALGLYLLGLFFAISGAVCFYESQDQFAGMWEKKSYQTNDNEEDAKRLFRSACQIKTEALENLKRSLYCFVIGGVAAAALMAVHFSSSN